MRQNTQGEQNMNGNGLKAWHQSALTIALKLGLEFN